MSDNMFFVRRQPCATCGEGVETDFPFDYFCRRSEPCARPRDAAKLSEIADGFAAAIRAEDDTKLRAAVYAGANAAVADTMGKLGAELDEDAFRYACYVSAACVHCDKRKVGDGKENICYACQEI
jgi:hypothetical protein